MEQAGRSLSNTEIDIHFRKGPFASLYGGCLSKDRLPKNGPGGKFFVINMQSFNEGDRQGSHWVGVIDCKIPDENPDATIYYDPFGLSPPPIIAQWMKKSDLAQIQVTDQHQPLSSTACGWYVIRVLEGILNSTPYEQIFTQDLIEDDYAHNEAYVRKLKLRK